jgi:hypothetical protein
LGQNKRKWEKKTFVCTQETAAKISKTLTGRKRPEEVSRKQAESLRKTLAAKKQKRLDEVLK